VDGVSSHLDYLDFDLSFQRREAGYRVRVLRAPGGEAQGTFEIPFQTLELENFLLKIGQPRRGTRRLDTPQTELTRAFGDKLFGALFDGDLLASLRSSLEAAGRQDRGVRLHRGLRLRLRMNETPELALIPWEYLHDPYQNQFVTLGTDSPIIRYLELSRTIPSLLVKPPLRILVIVSNPRGTGVLNSKDEWDRLNEALTPLLDTGRVVLEALGTPKLETLQSRLQGREIHVLHFIGHGGFNASASDGVLLFEDAKGNPREVTGGELGVLLRNCASIRLAVVNACDGARSSENDPFAGVAQSLVQQGLPAVIAMQFEISDDAARVFASGFYTALANGYPVEAALVEARTAIYLQRLGAEWGTPVLFMRAPDGHLFDLKADPSPSEAGGQKEYPTIERPNPRLLELLSFGLAAVSIIASLSWLLYHSGFSVLIAASRSLAGALSLIVSLASAGAYFVWRKASWGVIPQRSKSARKALLCGVLVGGFGYSATLLSKVSSPVRSNTPAIEQKTEVVLLIVNENSGLPLSSASIKVSGGGGEPVAEGVSDVHGMVHLILPSRLSSAELTFLVEHQGYQDGELVTVPEPGVTERVQLLPNASPQPFKSTFKFSGLPIRVSLNKELTQFNYGYSSLESDRTLIGQKLRITKVRVNLAVLVHSGDAVGNVDVLLGPGPDIFPPGPVSQSHYDNANRSTKKAPVQAHFVVGREPIMIGRTVHYYATYDFETRQAGGDSTNRKETDKTDFLARTISLPKGLFAQVVLWNGSAGGVDEEIKSLSLVVEGIDQGNNN
jgi:hypothetical protein